MKHIKSTFRFAFAAIIGTVTVVIGVIAITYESVIDWWYAKNYWREIRKTGKHKSWKTD